jgi:hypothetical protein
MVKRGLGLFAVGVALSVWTMSWAQGGLVARIGASGEFVEVSQQANGQTVMSLLPLHRAGNARYFSAGVGLEERSAEYPPFPLKIVFTAGGKPFLAGVAVTITPEKGGETLTIPQEDVEGPWLFVDVLPGVYQITGTHGGQKQRLNQVAVEAGKQKTVYLRWQEDRGLAAPLPAE